MKPDNINKKIDDLILHVDLSESTVDSDNRIIRNAVILSQISRDAAGKIRRKYTDRAIDSTIKNLEGAPACIGHNRTSQNQARSPLEYYGVYTGLKKITDQTGNSKAIGNLNVFKCPDGDKILDMAIRAPHIVGNSIHAGGMGRIENGVEIIEDVMSVTKFGNQSTIDLVTNPATTVNLFEDNNNPENKNQNQNRRNQIMEIDLKEATIDQVKIMRPDIVAHFDVSAEMKTLKESNETLTKENAELKTKIDIEEAKGKLTAKHSLISSLLEKSKLPPELITDTFKSSLMNVQESTGADGKTVSIESQIKELIFDRAKLAKTGVKNMGSGKSVDELFEDKTDTGKPDTKDLATKDIVNILRRVK